MKEFSLRTLSFAFSCLILILKVFAFNSLSVRLCCLLWAQILLLKSACFPNCWSFLSIQVCCFSIALKCLFIFKSEKFYVIVFLTLSITAITSFVCVCVFFVLVFKIFSLCFFHYISSFHFFVVAFLTFSFHLLKILRWIIYQRFFTLHLFACDLSAMFSVLFFDFLFFTLFLGICSTFCVPYSFFPRHNLEHINICFAWLPCECCDADLFFFSFKVQWNLEAIGVCDFFQVTSQTGKTWFDCN